jgi:hypothetical protein
MVGKTTPARSVPFFWTTIFGKSIRYAGYALEYDDVIIDKPENGFEPDTLNFVAYYAKGERIVSSQISLITSNPVDFRRLNYRIT